MLFGVKDESTLPSTATSKLPFKTDIVAGNLSHFVNCTTADFSSAMAAESPICLKSGAAARALRIEPGSHGAEKKGRLAPALRC
jgi:predicted deacylase